MTHDIYFIANIGFTHRNDPKTLSGLIQESAKYSCNAVRINYSQELESLNSETIYKLCHYLNIDIGYTVYKPEFVEKLSPYSDFWKVSSWDNTNLDLLSELAKTSKPIYISTGMTEFEDLEPIIPLIREFGTSNITFLHCISEHPNPASNAQLSCIERLREIGHQNGALIHKSGYSDHTHVEGVIYAAVLKWRAPVIEFHLSPNRKQDEYKQGHAWLPQEIGTVIANLILSYDGSGFRTMSPKELENKSRKHESWSSNKCI